MGPHLHTQEQCVEQQHRGNGERRIQLPVLTRNELGYHHGNAHGGHDHHTVSACRIIVVGLLAVLEPAHQRCQAKDPVDVEHHRRVDGVTYQRGRGLIAHHDRQHQHLDHHRGQGQDHRAVRIADILRQPFGMLGHAHRCTDDCHHQHQPRH
ncbi:hypothetical protein D3C76_1100700 [compost metagenome]